MRRLMCERRNSCLNSTIKCTATDLEQKGMILRHNTERCNRTLQLFTRIKRERLREIIEQTNFLVTTSNFHLAIFVQFWCTIRITFGRIL